MRDTCVSIRSLCMGDHHKLMNYRPIEKDQNWTYQYKDNIKYSS